MINTSAAVTIIKNPIDQKAYRYLELKNRLKVLLISDSTTDESAASLDVHVGSGSNPESWEGLAHFLEHMLFLGTAKYPEAGEYQEFIKNHGGSNNAYTSFDHTNYYFSISKNHLHDALDRFSHFFIDPTFDPTFVDRERSVVHSEYQARKKEENRRLWSAQKQWLNPNHPASRFSVGSLDTLRDRADKSVRDKLIEFYNQYYSANIMTLVVLGKEPLDQLEQWVSEKFTQIPNLEIAPQFIDQPYFDQSLTPAWLESIPEKDVNSVSYTFPVPTTLMEYRSKPLSYIANLLGHEGNGSLFSVIKSKGWAEGLSAGAGYTDTIQGTFSVRIKLTEKGLEHVDEIGGMLFQVINQIRDNGIESWRFDEQSRLQDVSFRFAQEHSPGQVVQSLASRLHLYPPEDVLQGPYIMPEYLPDRIRELLSYLHPNNLNISLRSRSLEAKQMTDYYDVAFNLKKINPDLIKRWQSVTENKSLKLPDPNPFIPDRLDLQNIEDPQAIPIQIDMNSGISLWYHPDSEFCAPKANFYVNIMSPLANRSAKDSVLAEIYTRMVDHQLSDVSYPAYLAELSYSVYRHRRGISVRVGGFEDKQSKLLKLIINTLANPVYDHDRFETIKTELLRELKNVAKDSPSNQIVHEIYRLLMIPYWTESERIDYLETASVDDLEKYVSEFYATVKVNALAHGDISTDSAVTQTKTLNTLFSNSEFVDSLVEPKIRILDEAQIYLRSLNVDHSDSALSVYFQGNNNTVEERARIQLLKHLLESSFNNQLRTINRVGYLVHTGTIQIDQYPGLFFSVQSPSHTPLEIGRMYTEFIEKFDRELKEMNQTQFDDIQSGLVTTILSKDKNLSERSDRYWREIDRSLYQFDSREKLANAISAFTLNDMQGYYSAFIMDRKKELIVQSLSNAKEAGNNIINGKQYTVTGDTAVFRQSDL